MSAQKAYGRARNWWPAGFQSMSPTERTAAIERGWWRDGEGHIVTADGRVMTEGGLFAPKARLDYSTSS